MKDKLTKTGHRKLFYRFRAIAIGFLFALTLLGVSSIPVIVTYTSVVGVKAEQRSVSSTSSPTQKANRFSISEYRD